jgi:hypothetical protein
MPPCPAACFTAVPCPDAGICSPGTHGALCNDGLFPQKDRVCVTGLCLTVANCPNGFQCVGVNAVIAAGFCSSGTVGEPCTKPSECVSGNCQLFGPLGICF